MSGTEAVMAAVRCARFNQRKPLCVVFGGAYHGWWDGMQPSAGNERTPQAATPYPHPSPLPLTLTYDPHLVPSPCTLTLYPHLVPSPYPYPYS